MKPYGYSESGFTGYLLYEGGNIFSHSRAGIGKCAKTSKIRTNRAMKRRSRQDARKQINSQLNYS